MKIIASCMVVVLLLAVHMPLLPGDMPGQAQVASKEQWYQFITKYVEASDCYGKYFTDQSVTAQNWDQVADKLYFSSTDGEYNELANGYPTTILIDNVIWPSADRFYHGMKFTDSVIRENIRIASSPDNAREIAHKNRLRIRPNWKQIRFGVMMEALYLKFNRFSPLYTLLMDTGSRVLILRTWNDDTFWGSGEHQRSANYAGRMLMLLRALLALEERLYSMRLLIPCFQLALGNGAPKSD